MMAFCCKTKDVKAVFFVLLVSSSVFHDVVGVYAMTNQKQPTAPRVGVNRGNTIKFQQYQVAKDFSNMTPIKQKNKIIVTRTNSRESDMSAPSEKPFIVNTESTLDLDNISMSSQQSSQSRPPSGLILPRVLDGQSIGRMEIAQTKPRNLQKLLINKQKNVNIMQNLKVKENSRGTSEFPNLIKRNSNQSQLSKVHIVFSPLVLHITIRCFARYVQAAVYNGTDHFVHIDGE